MEYISGVKVRRLRLIPDDRGWLMEILRSDWEEYETFGQVYVTTCYPGVVKAWHYHKSQTDHFTCVGGMAKVALYDPREDSPTKGMVNEFCIGPLNPTLIKIPRLVYHGFAAIGNDTAVIVNTPTAVYNYESPDEHRVPYDDPSIPYSWQVKMR
ncbi:MAG: dTDP-4-dehydrorhamnose 3,5-epimerase [Chloroflexi bacterium]|nr:MAG: dTDP-4-dehydrorhamnose 3,5-epimerase [Chloroflexota bacterium]RLC93840.1 MAG: dTDP-4-dehydrorhamnose 3,5-epimerase [Chloroflexota bacterium]